MNFQALALALGAAVFAHSVSFRVGPKRVSAFDTKGVPVHFTFADALKGAEMGLAGQDTSVQIGDVKIVVDAWPA
jgi:hypothetical protein